MSKAKDRHWEECLFCHKSDSLALLQDENGRWAVVCTSCGASGPDSLDMRVAQAKWNRRPEIDRLAAELREAREIIAKFPEAMRETK